MSVSGGLLQDGSAQVQVPDDGSRAQVKVVLHDLCDLFVGLLRSSITYIHTYMELVGYKKAG